MFKKRRFQGFQERIINDHTVFRISAAVHQDTHRNVKDRMRGIKGFKADSDYGLCLRVIMFGACEHLSRSDPNCRLAVMVEDGPWTSGAYDTYNRVAAMQAKWKPAKHAHRLAGFSSVPKGVRPSLEAADYIAAKEHLRATADIRTAPLQGQNILSYFLSEAELERWYEGMIEEKELRRAFGARNRAR